MKHPKTYVCPYCGHITEYNSFWQWLITLLGLSTPLGLYLKCSNCYIKGDNKEILIRNKQAEEEVNPKL